MSKPTTPNSLLRKSRRQSQRSSGVFGLLPQSPNIHYPIDPEHLPLESAINTEKFEQLSDCMEELESNMSNLQLIHNAMSRGFNESFAGFLYGLAMTMWCIDFPGTPSKVQWEKLTMSNEIDDRINDLEHQIALMKQENESLKVKMSNKLKLKPNILKTSKRTNTPDDDGTNTSDTSSFINYPATKGSKIPQLKSTTKNNYPVRYTKSSQLRLDQIKAKKAAQLKAGGSTHGSRIPSRTLKPAIPRFSSPVLQSKRLSSGPNLNQPPRYLDGLFDKPTSSSSSRSYR